MVYGAINEKGEQFYTYLPKLFNIIGNAQLDYNWLITDSDCNIGTPIDREVDEKGYCWISGEDLTKLVQADEIQWIFAVLSGFPKDVPLSEVLKYPLPGAQIYSFWHKPISMQHPLAVIEIVPWDSSLTLFFSSRKELVDKFRAGYPHSEDLTVYNARYALIRKKLDFVFGPYHLDVDVEQTREFYAKPYDIGCDCAGCKNFVQAVRQLPEDIASFFAQFGIDPAKPAEVYACHSADGIQTLYGGFYHICGNVLTGKQPWIQVAEKQFRLNEEYAVRLSSNFSIFFTENCVLVDEDFPVPVIQMEFTGELPWVIDEPNPYTH